MSEEAAALEKVRGVRFLPLFPLPLVLLPNELLPLHIFEPRYRQMLKDILAGNRLFGLSFLDQQNSDSTVPEIGSIGCAAEIREVQTLDDGRSNITTIGLIRYRLDEYIETGEPYLVANVTFFEDDEVREDEDDDSALKSLAVEVFGLFIRIASAAHELSGERGRFPEISQAPPQQLSFLTAAAFNLDAKIKYELLEMRSTFERLKTLREMLSRLADKIEESAALGKLAKTNGHSKKPIDFE